MKKVNAGWVPHMLTEDNHWNHIEAGLEILTRYNEEGDSFFKSDCNWWWDVTAFLDAGMQERIHGAKIEHKNSAAKI